MTRGGKCHAVNINVSPYNYKNSARMLVTFTIPADKSKALPRLRHKPSRLRDWTRGQVERAPGGVRRLDHVLALV